MNRDMKDRDGRRTESRALGGLACAWLAGFGALALASAPTDLVTTGTVVLSMPALVGLTLWGRARGWWASG